MIDYDAIAKKIKTLTGITTPGDRHPLGILTEKNLWHDIAEHATYEGDLVTFLSDNNTVHVEKFLKRNKIFYRLAIADSSRKIIELRYYRPRIEK